MRDRSGEYNMGSVLPCVISSLSKFDLKLKAPLVGFPI